MKKTTDLKGSPTARTLFYKLCERGGKSLATLVFGLAVFAFSSASAFANTYTVSSPNDSGAGTLRQAILDANSNAGADTIAFGGSGTISPTSSLPQITDTVTITGSNGVILDGASAGGVGIGLRISAPNSVVQGLTITRFQEAGIRIDGGGSGTVLRGNFIGTNGSNAMGMGNFNRGILIVGTTGNTIGGANAGDRNIISGNLGRGIEITAGGAATIINNFIGTTVNGLTDLGNTQQGILIANSSGSQIGNGTTAGRNVISGNGSHGIAIIADVGTPASNNSVQGNFIGTDATGNARLISNATTMTTSSNDGSGISIQAANNIVGGTSAATRNVISGNAGNGVVISTSLATGNSILGNFIGVGANGTPSASGTPAPLLNRNNGVQVSNLSAGNFIGSTAGATRGGCTGGCNLITGNGDPNSQGARAGVYVDGTAGTGNSIRGNSIFTNTGIGIDLGINPPIPPTGTPPMSATGVTPNDMNDPDTGANDLQNFPVISASDSNGVIAGTLNSLPSTIFAIDFYANSPSDTGAGEGRTYIGTTNVVTDGSGNATFGFATRTPLTAGQSITSTATNASTAANNPALGDTSEFSAPQTVAAATTTNAAGIEADVFTRPNGDGFVDSVDVGQIRRFSLGQDKPFQSNEFQRADCFPLGTRGDGVIDSLDIGQAKRYQLSLDSPQTAGGQTTGTPAPPPAATNEKAQMGKADREAPQAPREVRVVSTTTNPGGTVTVTLGVDAMGDESIYGFSVNYNSDNSNRLTNPVVTNPSPATRQVSTSLGAGNTNPGEFGVVVDFSGSGSGQIAPGNGQTLITITFTVPTTAMTGTVPVNFTDTPTRRSVSSNPNTGPIQSLATTFTNGSVTIRNAPTAAGVTVKGRVLAGRRIIANARVSLTNSAGVTRVATTDRNGYYRFNDVAAGETYVFAVRSARRYEFATQVVNITENTDNLNFNAEQ